MDRLLFHIHALKQYLYIVETNLVGFFPCVDEFYNVYTILKICFVLQTNSKSNKYI